MVSGVRDRDRAGARAPLTRIAQKCQLNIGCGHTASHSRQHATARLNVKSAGNQSFCGAYWSTSPHPMIDGIPVRSHQRLCFSQDMYPQSALPFMCTVAAPPSRTREFGGSVTKWPPTDSDDVENGPGQGRDGLNDASSHELEWMSQTHLPPNL